MTMIGVYKITNKASGEFYIGSSIDIRQRFHAHKSLLRREMHQNRYLQRAWNKYGEDNFSFRVLWSGEIEETRLRIIEGMYLNILNPVYNLARGISGTMAGYKHSEEFARNASERMTGEKNPWHGKTWGDKHPRLGTHHTEETKKKMRDNHADFNGEKSHNSKLTTEKVIAARELYGSGDYTYKEIGDMFGVSLYAIHNAVSKRTWKCV